MLENLDPDLIRIRAHHLLCLQGFQGYGYDQDFTLGLEKILGILNSDPSRNIEIISESDDICTNCPNLMGKQCVNYSKIKKLDVHVISNSSLIENNTITFRRALEIVDHDLSSENIKTVCDDCVWMDKCLFFIKKNSL